jgi:hypothetical protein
MARAGAREREFAEPTLPGGATPAPGIPADARPSGAPRPGPDADYAGIAQEGVNAIKRGGSEVRAKIVGKVVPAMGGNTRLRKDSMKYQALAGRVENRSAKAAFKDGSQDARDTDGLLTVTVKPGTMRSPAAKAMSKRAAVKRPGKAGQADAQ